MPENIPLSFDDFRTTLINRVSEITEETDESAKIVYLQEILEQYNDIHQVWDTEPDYYQDNRIQGSFHTEDWDRIDIFISEFHGQNTFFLGYNNLKKNRERFNTAMRLIESAFEGKYYDIEEANELHDFSKSIFEHMSEIRTIRYFLATDFPYISEKIPPIKSDKIITEFHLLTLENSYDLFCSEIYSTESGKPLINTIDLVNEFDGASIPCIPITFSNPDSVEYDSYLGYMEGQLLAKLYNKYTEKLLEGNIRVFLQNKGAVNKGIRSSLKNPVEKTRFFAYNNGISATANSVDINYDETGKCRIEKITGIQIVNGGQTTASMHSAMKDRIDLTGVYVQFKLTVPKKEESLNILNPKIAEYSNSQNQIKKADFSSNLPYHIRLEQLSRSLNIPDSDTFWFYERTRGKYGEAKRIYVKKRGEPNFDVRYPSNKKITKLELALYANSWNQYPNYAAKGGEKNFVKFMDLMKDPEGNIAVFPDERYYHELVAMAILFKRTDSLRLKDAKTSDYGTSYKRQIVVYTLSLMSYLTEGRLNLIKIWADQTTGKNPKLNDAIEDYILSLSKVVEYHIHHPPVSHSNKSEWPKYEGCWTSLKDKTERHIPPPENVQQLYLSPTEVEDRKRWLESLYHPSGDEQSELSDDIQKTATSTETNLSRESEKPETQENALSKI